jgi:hypothetical protein
MPIMKGWGMEIYDLEEVGLWNWGMGFGCVSVDRIRYLGNSTTYEWWFGR